MKKYFIIFAIFFPILLFADVPIEINYTGFLREFGQPVTGQRNIELKIYTQPTGGTPIWSSGVMNVDVSSGIFSCLISPSIDFRDGNFWIETIVNNKIFSPRQKIVPQMFAVHSRTAENLSKKSDIHFVVGTTTSVIVSVSSINVVGKVKEYGYDLLPRGVIVMWSGSIANIPPGWALCDGGTYEAPDGTWVTTPNLRDRFIVGAGGSYAVGATGGANTVTLTVEHLPSHSHTFSGTTSSAGAHTHNFWGSGSQYEENNPLVEARSSSAGWWTGFISTSGEHTHSFSGTTSSVGGGQPHENRPPYYALAFIMKL